MQKSADAFRTISEVADDLSLPQHVLRFWETRFPQIRPLKRAGGRRYYRPTDVLLLKTISQLLYDDGYTIKGVQRLLKEQGAKGVSTAQRPSDAEIPTSDPDLVAREDDRLVSRDPEANPVFEQAEPLIMPDSGAALTHAQRGAIEAALSVIDDCQGILDALHRRPAT